MVAVLLRLRQDVRWPWGWCGLVGPRWRRAAARLRNAPIRENAVLPRVAVEVSDQHDPSGLAKALDHLLHVVYWRVEIWIRAVPTAVQVDPGLVERGARGALVKVMASEGNKGVMLGNN